jgi:hypothetical protein
VIGYIGLGICGSCGVQRTVRTYEPNEVTPSCNCTSVPPTYEMMVEERYQHFLELCRGEDLSTVLLRMQAVQGAIAQAAVASKQVALLAAMLDINALSRLVAENLLIDDEEEEAESDEPEDPSAP